MPFYVFDEHGQRQEAYTKQEVLSVIEQAIEDGTLEWITSDSGFIDKIRCCVGGETHKMAFVTEAQYLQLQAQGQIEDNAYYYITDDRTYNELATLIENIANGTEPVPQALHAVSTENTDFTNNTTWKYAAIDATQSGFTAGTYEIKAEIYRQPSGSVTTNTDIGTVTGILTHDGLGDTKIFYIGSMTDVPQTTTNTVFTMDVVATVVGSLVEFTLHGYEIHLNTATIAGLSLYGARIYYRKIR